MASDPMKELIAMASRRKLSLMVDYYKRVARLLMLEAEDLENSDDEVKRHNAISYGNHFPRYLQDAVFLMMHAWIEEYLDIADRIKPCVSLSNSKFGVKKYKPLFKEVLDDEFEQSDDWKFLMDATDVRHCLVHKAGRMDLMNKPQNLERILRERPECFSKHKARIYARPQALQELGSRADRLLSQVFKHETRKPGHP